MYNLIFIKKKKKKNSQIIQGTSLVVPWLSLCLAVQGMHVQYLVGELRPHVLQLLSPRLCPARKGAT